MKLVSEVVERNEQNVAGLIFEVLASIKSGESFHSHSGQYLEEKSINYKSFIDTDFAKTNIESFKDTCNELMAMYFQNDINADEFRKSFDLIFNMFQDESIFSYSLKQILTIVRFT